MMCMMCSFLNSDVNATIKLGKITFIHLNECHIQRSDLGSKTILVPPLLKSFKILMQNKV